VQRVLGLLEYVLEYVLEYRSTRVLGVLRAIGIEILHLQAGVQYGHFDLPDFARIAV
jgi:hypothetical protein